MEQAASNLDARIARRLKDLRTERHWSLDELARASGVSRASLSRLENAEVSATAEVLGRLCAAYGLPMSRLLRMVEDDFVPLWRRARQEAWEDRSVGFVRRLVSPPATALQGEVLECTLAAGAEITYDRAPRLGQEHHLLLLDGRLAVTLGAETHALEPGDCLRYRLDGPSAFRTPAERGARYLLFLV